MGKLITNPIKFTDEGGSVEISIKIDSDGDEEHNNVVVKVSDTGVGMEESKIEEITNG